MSESASFSKRYSLLALLLAFSCSARQDGAPEVAEKGQAPSAEPTRPVPFSDSLENYSIVLKPEVGFVAVGRKGEELYQVFLYDNGPDYPSDGYFRIVENGKIGYADGETGAVRIKPQYAAAYPFQNGYAPICPDCETEKDGEHSRWVNGKWGLIDKQGRVVLRPEFEEVLEVGNDGRALVAVNGGQKWVRIE